MEKFSQFRDRGSGIAPFLPIPTEPSGFSILWHTTLFVVRVPITIFIACAYFLVIQWLPVPWWAKKATLWALIGCPGLWWVDLRLDYVKKGALAQNMSRLPRPGSVIAANFTSPIDALYLAAIFDPIFTASYPSTRQVEQISLIRATLRAFSRPRLEPPPNATMLDLQSIVQKNPDRIVVVFPECTTTNGKGILPLSPSLLSLGPRTKVFPLSMRYTPADITTPIPGKFLTFLWVFHSKPSHCIKVRIADSLFNASQIQIDRATSASGYNTNFFDTPQDDASSSVDTLAGDESEPSREDQVFLDKVGEALARLGRSKRVGLGVKEKVEFVRIWSESKKRR